MSMPSSISNRLRRTVRLLMPLLLVAGFLAIDTGIAAASLQSMALGSQQGALAAGTAGSVQFQVSLTRSNNSPSSVTFTATGLPTGAALTSTSATQQPYGNTLTLVVSTTSATPLGSFLFNVVAHPSSGNTTRNASATLVVKQGQTITFGPLVDKVSSDPDFAVSASTSSGLAATFSATGQCSVAGMLVHLTGAGSCVITASQAGNATFGPAPEVSQSFAVAQGQTIAFAPIGNRVIGEVLSLVATSDSGLPVTLTAAGAACAIGVGGLLELNAAGLCAVTASQAGDATYAPAADVVQNIAVAAVSGVDAYTELYARTGSTTIAGATVNVWGYNTVNAPVTQPGGPVLDVTVGDTVGIMVHNGLDEATSLFLQGQPVAPDLIGVPVGGTTFYRFTATKAGTFLYEAGLLANSQHQAAMGLYGALVVHPLASASQQVATGAGQAYGADSAFSQDAVLVLGEIDPNLNKLTNPATFDMRKFAPRYFLINGQAYPSTTDIAAAANGDVLLRYVNAGMLQHSMGVLGAQQEVIGLDGNPLTYPRTYVAETFGPGQTTDVLVRTTNAGSTPAKVAVYDAALGLHNSNAAGYGGMMTFIDVAAAGTDLLGPLTSAVSYGAGTLAATADDSSTGGSNVAAAEYFVDVLGASGTGTAMAAVDSAFDSSAEEVAAALTLDGDPHTIYVHAEDLPGNWGPLASLEVNPAVPTDTAGPVTTGLVIMPGYANGTNTVTIQATGNDTGSGGSDIMAAEYFIGAVGAAGAGTALTVNVNAPIASLDGTIPSAVGALADGIYVVAVHSQDSAGNWGGFTTVNLTVDKTGPTTSGVAASPNPSNGQIGVNSSTPAVRVTASVADTNAVKGAEGFIDAVGSPGSGYVLIAVDGAFDAGTESVFADIPLTTVSGLSAGDHTIFVRGRDAAGNWGAVSTVVLTVDRVAPTINGSVTVTPTTPTNGTAVVHVTATFADNAGGTGVRAAEGFVDSVGTSGTGFAFVAFDGAFNALSERVDADIPMAVLTGLTNGTHTVYVHARDAAGNWSLVSSRTFSIDKIAPTVTITTADYNPNSAPSVHFTVTFSENITGTVAAANFTVIRGGAVTGGTVTSVTGTGTTRAVTVSGYSGLGTVRLNLTSAGNIADLAGNPLVGVPVTGQVYTIVAPTPLYFSTLGSTTVPGVGGTADAADIYYWDGVAYSRAIDARTGTGTLGLPSGANVDGFDRVDATHFYLSFTGQVTVPVLGNVQDEDVVYYSNGTWLLFFDGSANGLGGTTNTTSFDLDAISIVGGSLYFSTDTNNIPTGAGGTGDDADIYRWNGGSSYTRVVDASTIGIPAAANVDGFVRVDTTHFYMSFAADTTLPGVGAVQDEDVVYRNGATWSVYFDGTSKGLTANNLDIDAFDLP